MAQRIQFLDGLRGLAIILVILFHGYARWWEYVPYAREYAKYLVVQEGWLGVNLFFMISGFVILLTLEKCQGVWEFLYRRWLRLFPAMLVASLLVFFTQTWLSEGPSKALHPIDILPGLSFIEPDWLASLFGQPVKSLEYAFWSLYVEVKFYIVAAVLYFWKGRNVLLGFLIAAYLLVLAINLSDFGLPGPFIQQIRWLDETLSLRYFGWFASGAMFYVFYTSRNWAWFVAALGLGVLCGFFVWRLQYVPRPSLMGVSIVLLFAAVLVTPLLQRLFSLRWILFLGAVSYPLYLIHENALIAFTVKSDGLNMAWGLGLPPGLMILPGLALLVLAAYLIMRFIEPVIKRWLKFPKTPGARGA